MPSQQRLDARQILGLGQLDLNFIDELLLVYTGTDLYLRHAREPKKFPQRYPVPNHSLLQLNGLAAIANAPCWKTTSNTLGHSQEIAQMLEPKQFIQK